jgi:hypothetical protein
VGGLLLLTGVGIGATALLAVFEAAAISNMVSPHMLELVHTGEYSQLMSDVVSGSVNGLAEATNAANSTGASSATPEKSPDPGDIPTYVIFAFKCTLSH